MQFVMPVYVLSSIVLGGTEVSGSEEQDPACDLALIFGLTYRPDGTSRSSRQTTPFPVCNLWLPTILGVPSQFSQLIYPQKEVETLLAVGQSCLTVAIQL